jgi:hypothetical protein
VSAVGTAAGGDDELRNTIVNILQALVQKGVLTREQAQALVADAQAKAATAAKDKAQQQAATQEAEKGAIRVPYVPQIVRDQIASEVSANGRADVAQQVVERAKAEGWGVPAGLPDWIRGVRLYGDVRVRAERDFYASGNAQNFYLNYLQVNAAGGRDKAGINALLNTTQSRSYVTGRLRFGAIAQLGNALRADFRISSGSANNPISANQTFGDYGTRWALAVDRAALLWNPHTSSWRQDLDVRFGRFENPFVTYNEMIWDVDLNFEGLSTTWDWNRVRGKDERTSRWLFATAGAFLLQSPGQSVPFAEKDKWLYAGQIGSEIPFSWDSKLRLAVAYYDYANVTGRRNSLGSNLLDYTAPLWMTKGNTLFDISNSTDPTVNLYALAGKYRLLSALVQLDLLAFGQKHVVVSGEYVRNIGWTTRDVLARTGNAVTARTSGYEAGVSVGYPQVAALGQWRAAMSYRYLQRDAVLDAFTDSDFHLGGTDARGYIVTVDVGLARWAFARLRYLSANQIDEAPLGIDVAQLDLMGRF